VDGIKYERVDGAGPEAEWEMLLFKDEELVNFLTAQKVKKSIYEYVPPTIPKLSASSLASWTNGTTFVCL
jgi:hypothetical protein